jgi:ribosome-associated protein
MSDPSTSQTLILRGEHITLAQALKAVGATGTGGHAKHVVRNGDATVNGVVVTQPGRKLHAGDRFGCAGEGEWTIIS